jgi:hypothetical protein
MHSGILFLNLQEIQYLEDLLAVWRKILKFIANGTGGILWNAFVYGSTGKGGGLL